MRNWHVESEFIHNGLKCVVVLQTMGHRCGYVGIDKTHPLFGVDYAEEVCALNNESPEMKFDIHGGITYSGNGELYPIKSNLWWFGFDCAHCGDGKDFEACLKAFSDDDKIVQQINRIKSIEEQFSFGYDEIRTREYVEQECKNLANQLKDIS